MNKHFNTETEQKKHGDQLVLEYLANLRTRAGCALAEALGIEKVDDEKMEEAITMLEYGTRFRMTLINLHGRGHDVSGLRFGDFQELYTHTDEVPQQAPKTPAGDIIDEITDEIIDEIIDKIFSQHGT